ncbi:hypothetical protein Dda_3075 [Drechslerella dactyloides]|uniref:Uncharacterized protein n=1 Tax=Drechslerella dactyloides TaxID=74499 RepID=A0AAD6NKX2_DREDA|nr:hypothetical protein Dda_3075 [Drechslerella dactyloides]
MRRSPTGQEAEAKGADVFDTLQPTCCTMKNPIIDHCIYRSRPHQIPYKPPSKTKSIRTFLLRLPHPFAMAADASSLSACNGAQNTRPIPPSPGPPPNRPLPPIPSK